MRLSFLCQYCIITFFTIPFIDLAVEAEKRKRTSVVLFFFSASTAKSNVFGVNNYKKKRMNGGFLV